MDKPLLLVDVDGVISLFGFDHSSPPPGRFEWVDGIAHFLSAAAGEHLCALAESFELVWCTGWEEKANEYLPHALELPDPLAHVVFDGDLREVGAHWKLAAIDRHVESARPIAWIDDALDHTCHEWAARRAGPTLLLETDPAVGITAEHVATLNRWAASLSPRSSSPPCSGCRRR